MAHKNYNQRRIAKQQQLFQLKHNKNCCNYTERKKSKLKRKSLSQPYIYRNWLCQSCKFDNSTITWHCLNCNHVSFLAPIYKDTFKNLSTISSPLNNSVTSTPVLFNNNNFLITTDRNLFCNKNDEHYNDDVKSTLYRSVSMDSGLHINRTKCQLCLFNRYDLYHPSNKFVNCKHINKSRDSVLLNIQNEYNKLTSFTTSIKKSHSSILAVDFEKLSKLNNKEKIDENNTKEKFDRPNSLIVTNNKKYLEQSKKEEQLHFKQLSLPDTDIEYKFINNIKPSCDICSNINDKSCCSKGDNTSIRSRFTVSTLRKSSKPDNTSITENLFQKSTIPKNECGGVFISVRDWNFLNEPKTLKMSNNCYENVRETVNNNNNDNENPSYENHTIIEKYKNEMKEKLLSSNEPIYAVVNKLNKIRAKVGMEVTQPQHLIKSTNFPCINTVVEADSSSENLVKIEKNNNVHPESALTNFAENCMSSNLKTSHLTNITCNNLNNITTISNTCSDNYSKVWKGPKKSEAQKNQ